MEQPSLTTYTKKRTRNTRGNKAAGDGVASPAPASAAAATKKQRGSSNGVDYATAAASPAGDDANNHDARKLALLELYRLLHCMEESPHGINNNNNNSGDSSAVAASSSSSSWQALLARADHGRHLYQQVTAGGGGGGGDSILSPAQAKVVQERLEACCRRAAEIAQEQQKKNQPQRPGLGDAVWAIFQRQTKPAAAAAISAAAISTAVAAAGGNVSSNSVSPDLLSGMNDDSVHVPKAPPPTPTVSAAAAAAGNNAVRDLQEEQREQMERAIGHMASQLKNETSKIHAKLKVQATELDALEKVATDNVDAVTDVAQLVEAHVSKTWRRNLGTWTLIFTMIGAFLFCLLTIQMAPKARIDWSRYYTNDNNNSRRYFGLSSIVQSVPALVSSVSETTMQAFSTVSSTVSETSMQAYSSVSATCTNAISSVSSTEWAKTSEEWISSLSVKAQALGDSIVSSMDWQKWMDDLKKIPKMLGVGGDDEDDEDDDEMFDLEALKARERQEAAAAAAAAAKRRQDQQRQQQQQPPPQQQERECEMDMNGECIDITAAAPSAQQQEDDLHQKAAEATPAIATNNNNDNNEPPSPLPVNPENMEEPLADLADAQQQEATTGEGDDQYDDDNERQQEQDQVEEEENEEEEEQQGQDHVEDYNEGRQLQDQVEEEEDTEEEQQHHHDQVEEEEEHEEQAETLHNDEEFQEDDSFGVDAGQESLEANTEDNQDAPVEREDDPELTRAQEQEQAAASSARIQRKDTTLGGRANPMDDAFSSGSAVDTADADDVPVFDGRPFSPKDVRRAAALGEVELIKGYLSVRPDWCDKQDNNGWSAIHMATRLGHLDAIEVLVTSGHCNVGLETVDGRSALMLASQILGEQHAVTQFLQEHTQE